MHGMKMDGSLKNFASHELKRLGYLRQNAREDKKNIAEILLTICEALDSAQDIKVEHKVLWLLKKICSYQVLSPITFKEKEFGYPYKQKFGINAKFSKIKVHKRFPWIIKIDGKPTLRKGSLLKNDPKEIWFCYSFGDMDNKPITGPLPDIEPTYGSEHSFERGTLNKRTDSFEELSTWDYEG